MSWLRFLGPLQWVLAKKRPTEREMQRNRGEASASAVETLVGAGLDALECVTGTPAARRAE